ncbi:MAG TPA: polysaccharide lyase 6 family protein [Ferruginibacter sp.]|nr:polysaccharide lyase 6 family protein [Ferruginibacter sp.]
MIKQPLFSLIFIILLSVVGFSVKAEEYLVATAVELKDALQKVKAGDVVIWKDGSYADMKINFQPKQNGSADLWIVLKAQTAGKVIFKGSSQLILNGSYLRAEGFLFEGKTSLEKGDVMAFSKSSKYCRITNCAVIDYTPADAMVNNNWMNLQGTYNEVDHCYFKGKTNQGPYLVVRYLTDDSFIDGSDTAPSTYHRIHHNYFGYRSMPTDNGGEDLRIGDSKTSFTRGFNIIEYNYFEDHRLEPEVISNKSCDNIYRFNTFINNDGAMVLRHGQRCFVYGNYFNGKAGRNKSGGIRIINSNQTVFNNYLENLEGGKDYMKAPFTIMGGLLGSNLNEYYPAHNAIVAYNTVVNSVGAGSCSDNGTN